MPRNGSGTYTLPAGNPVVSGSVASSSDFNSTMNDLAAALTNSLSKDGQTVVAGNLPMGGYKHTDVDDATARNQYASAGQVQDGSLLVLGGVSGTDAIVASATPAVTALTTGQTFRFRSAGENGGPVTLAVNGLSAVSVLKYGTEALVTADIASQGVCEVFYDGTHFQLLNPQIVAAENLPADASQSEMETGTETGIRRMSPLRVAQAVAAQDLPAANLTGDVAAARITDALNASGSAPVYACRAWVNFDGTTNTGGNCDIRASGNVSSVTDNGVGDYTVNFEAAMPDADYATVINTSRTGINNTLLNASRLANEKTAPTTTAVRVASGVPDFNRVFQEEDVSYFNISIFR